MVICIASACIFLLWRRVPLAKLGVPLLVLVLGSIALILRLFVLGTNNNSGIRVIVFLNKHRIRFAASCALVSLMPLVVGAMVLQRSPGSLAVVGPLVVLLVGLVSLTTLLGTLVYTVLEPLVYTVLEPLVYTVLEPLVYTVPVSVGAPWAGVAVLAVLQIWGGQGLPKSSTKTHS